MNITYKTCLLVISIQLLHIISAQEMAKRVPQGFVGMRGKKYQGSRAEHFYKRKPQFFVGVKGKKSIDYFDDLYSKRVPMGFVGMRGKKDNDEYETHKRVPSFSGMRGKKEMQDYLDSAEYVPKRASLIGQIDYSTNEDALQDSREFPLLQQLLNNYYYQILTENTDASNQTTEEIEENSIEKRAVNMHQFFGVRGKKSVQQKRPFDLNFRGKFIGVRGKKDVKTGDDLKFLLENNGPWPKRKGPVWFYGTRGKKMIDDSNVVEADYSN